MAAVFSVFWDSAASKKIGQSAGRIFPHGAEKGRTAASLLRAQPGVSPWGFADYGSPNRLCGGADFFRMGRKRGAKRQAFCGRSPVFLRGALRVTVRRAAFAAADFFARGGKGAQSGEPFAGAARCFPWGFADYGSPSRFCGGEFFRTGRKRAQSGKPFAGAARFFSVGLCGLRFAEPLLRRRIFPHGAGTQGVIPLPPPAQSGCAGFGKADRAAVKKSQ